MLEPASIDELIAAINTHPKVLAVGGGTKPRLCTADGAEILSVGKLTGITQYEPSEYTFTALAGTTIREVRQTLAERGQYLPFDPCFANAGATLGGTVASGISGAGRFRYGGVRDFLIGIRFVDGKGRLLSGGGKVVKNAAGFDTPKLMVGSLGRLGVLAELTFKVFPKPESLRTLRISCTSHSEAMKRLTTLASGRWELDALDYLPASRSLFARFGGPTSTISELADSLAKEFAADAACLSENEADIFWTAQSEPSSEGITAKAPMTPRSFLAMQARLDSPDVCSVQLSAGGSFAWITISNPENLSKVDDSLRSLELGGLVITGATPSLWIGHRPNRAIDAAVKKVFDPDSRFPDF
jgi:glycolate oxidase FAD binding subunit